MSKMPIIWICHFEFYEAQHHDIDVMLGFLLSSIPQLRGNHGYSGA